MKHIVNHTTDITIRFELGILICATLAIVGFASPGYADEFELTKTVVSGSGGRMSDGEEGDFVVTFTIGQPVAGATGGGDFELGVGFFPPLPPPSCPPADPLTQPPGEHGYEKTRYISMEPGNPGQDTALRVTLANLPEPFSGLNGTKCWVGEPQQVSENAGKINHVQNWPDFWSANLDGNAHCMDWSTTGVLHVTDDDIIPGAVYDVQAIDCGCDSSNEGNYSAPLTITTSIWGDLVRNCATYPCGPPDGVVGIPTDVTACLDKFKNLANAVIKARADIEPNFPDWLVNISDVMFVVDGFRGSGYPPFGWTGPDGCP
ncbi:MAG: hypothetical protein JSU86_03830 [Phycisphaerales bacterium]|nr:MAG: hypothetical protein JSU86_03830 [Phycisphaerales bacterium]